ncbi:ABC transporter ATP-binding protein [Desulfurococcaceae archaeon MEX13E-LK6-19]|nr:ABC transporter ATP-binding protein [Desulfurococcaceae archaeon MEX13E-LK6-19]
MVLEAVVAEGLGKKYKNGVWGAVDVSFSVREGSIAVLLGPNGAGKTTTIGMLTTILKPTRGRGLVAGYDVVKQVREVRRKIALCPQDVHIDPNWTPWEAVVGYLWARGIPKSDARVYAKKWLEELELWDVRNRVAYSLSGGQRKRIAVAMVLASEADVIFLDEPTAGLDVEGRYKVWKALREAVRDGRTILLTTHDMNEAETVSDKLVLIHKGRVVDEGKTSEIKKKLPYTHKVVLKKPRMKPSIDNDRILELGDTLIIYTNSYREALSIASDSIAESVSIQTVSLEDVYLYIVKNISG